MFETMKENLKKVENNISIISAFCKKEALEFIDSQIQGKEEISKRILIRFRLDDILSQATDKIKVILIKEFLHAKNTRTKA